MWTVYKIAAKQIRLGTFAAVDESEAIEKAAKEVKQPARKLYAVGPIVKGSGQGTPLGPVSAGLFTPSRLCR
jgi:hypothetical protein